MRRVPRSLFVGLVVSMWAGAAGAQEGGPPLPKPTKEHDLLKKDVGTWDAMVKTWTSPQAEPMESKATETNRMLPGGLWLLSEFKGEFGGLPFQGRGQTSYDAAKKKYVGTWVDSMVTTPMLMEGTYDEAAKTMTMTGDSVDMTGKTAKAKMVTVYKNDGARVFTMSMKSDTTGPEFVKMMEITYTKRPKDAAKVKEKPKGKEKKKDKADKAKS
jgi:Protein of unknown function (DUF1579)